MKLKYFLIAFCLFTGLMQVCAQEQDELSVYLERGEYLKIKSIADSRLAADSTDLMAISALAKVYESEQNIAKAIKYNTLKWRLDTTNYLVARKLGQLYEDAEIFKEALMFYGIAYRQNPEDFITTKGFCNVLISTENLGLADTILSTALINDSLNVAHLLNEARLAYKLRDMPRTSSALMKAGDLTNLSNYFQRMLGYALLQQDSTELAIRYLRYALENDRNPEVTYYYLALAYERKKDDQSALAYFDKAISEGISKDLGTYYFRKGQIFFFNKDYKNACLELEAALEHNVNKAICHYYLGVAYDNRYKNKAKAMHHFEKSTNESGFIGPEMRQYAEVRLLQLKEMRHQKQ